MSAFEPTPVANPRIRALPPASKAVIPAFHFWPSVHRIVRRVLDTNRVGLGVQGLGLFVVALGLIEPRQVVETGGDQRVTRSQELASDRQ